MPIAAPVAAPARIARTRACATRVRARARPSLAVRAAQNDTDDSIEALENRLKTKRAQSATAPARGRGAAPERPNPSGNPAFGYLDTAAKRNRVRAGANGSLALWEGDPERWDAMSASERAWVCWTGEKGWMYWMNQASLYGAGGLAFFWVAFRFVGPALGLYQLR